MTGPEDEPARESKIEQERVKRICLELMEPMVREFTTTLTEMRRKGASEEDIASMLRKVESRNRGRMDELRRICARTASPSSISEQP
jgi:hypothetical protein